MQLDIRDSYQKDSSYHILLLGTVNKNQVGPEKVRFRIRCLFLCISFFVRETNSILKGCETIHSSLLPHTIHPNMIMMQSSIQEKENTAPKKI